MDPMRAEGPNSPSVARPRHGRPADEGRRRYSDGGCARQNVRSRRPQTVSRRRPLSRLARRVALPPLVDIRLRNPWVLARLRVFGWYVRFTSGWPFLVPRRRSAVDRGYRCQPGESVAGLRESCPAMLGAIRGSPLVAAVTTVYVRTTR